MKKLKLFSMVGAVVLIGLTSCEKSENLTSVSLEGTYVGTLSFESGLKSLATSANDIQNATAEVTDMGNGLIEVHCYSEGLDTTFILNHYENNDSIMVCLNDSAFAKMYGHMMGQGGMMGNTDSNGMMGGVKDGNTEWMNHMNMEHKIGDEHFGGFNMTNHTFDYTIKSEHSDYHFQGTKIDIGM